LWKTTALISGETKADASSDAAISIQHFLSLFRNFGNLSLVRKAEAHERILIAISHMENLQPPLRVAVFLLSIVLSASGFAAPAAKPALLDLAREKFAPRALTEAEEKLFVATEKGEMASMLVGINEADDPADARQWPDYRTLDASALAWLATDPEALRLVTPRGIQISGMRIVGDLNLSDIKMVFPFIARDCFFEANILLPDARLTSFVLQHCFLQGLDASRAHFDGVAFLFGGCQAEEPVSFADATINGSLNCDGAHFCKGFDAQVSKIGGNFFARQGFAARSEVNLIGATVAGNLEFDGAWLYNPGGVALQAERVKVGGHVFLRPDQARKPESKPFRADGEVSLFGATIGGSLFCDGAQLNNPGKNKKALLADGCKITGNARLQDGFRPAGTVDFGGAIVEDTFFWVKVEVVKKTTVLLLYSAKLGTLHGHKETWPVPGDLGMDGLVYDRIEDETPTTGKDRTKWLELQPSDQPHTQPYEQLASVLRKMGRDGEMREVMVAKNWQFKKFTHPFSADWWWYACFGNIIGYGYQPWRPFFMSLGLIILGAFLFWRGYSGGILVPTKESAYEKQNATAESAATNGRPIAESYPRFSAVVYSLESFTPLLKLDQSSNWAPNANRGRPLQVGRLRLGTTGSWLRVYLWLHIILGWVLTSLWVGSITGLVKT
jgi:hypothetical protein